MKLKTRYKRALENGTILIVGTKCTTNGWTQFKVFFTDAQKHKGESPLERIDVEEAAPELSVATILV